MDCAILGRRMMGSYKALIRNDKNRVKMILMDTIDLIRTKEVHPDDKNALLIAETILASALKSLANDDLDQVHDKIRDVECIICANY